MDAQAKEIKNKVMCEINSFAIVYFFFDETLYKLRGLKVHLNTKNKRLTLGSISE
jgi:hypothetical protein